MFVCESVIERHVLKIRFDMFSIEMLNHLETEAGVDENRPEIGLNHVGQTLRSLISELSSVKAIRAMLPSGDPQSPARNLQCRHSLDALLEFPRHSWLLGSEADC